MQKKGKTLHGEKFMEASFIMHHVKHNCPDENLKG